MGNLAAALDHAVFGLSVAHAERSLSGRARRSIGFPIHADAAGFEKSGRGQIRFLPPGLQAVIEADQPFHRPSEVARLNHPLEVLRELWNADKHRALLLATAKPELLGVGMHQADLEGSHRFTAPHVAFGTVVSRLVPTGGQDPREPYFEVRIVLAPHPDVRSPIAFVSSVESLGLSMFRHVAFVLSQLGLDAFPVP